MMEVAEVNSTIGKHTKKEFLKTRDSQRTFSSYLMLSPVIFGFVVFSLYPMICGNFKIALLLCGHIANAEVYRI